MECKNHAGVAAVDRCAGCSEALCANCLVEIRGRKYCGQCKVMAIDRPPVIETETRPCKEAGEALTYAIIGIFCCVIILEPIAIAKAIQAKKKISLNPRLSGSGKATAALIIGVGGLILWVIDMIVRFEELSNM